VGIAIAVIVVRDNNTPIVDVIVVDPQTSVLKIALVGFVGCRRQQFGRDIDMWDDMPETCQKMSARHLATSAFLVPFLARQCRVIFASCQHVVFYILPLASECYGQFFLTA
jgi:hypothetical protein